MENKENELVVLTKDEYEVLSTDFKYVSNINVCIKSLLDNTVMNYLKIGFLLDCLTDELLNQLGCNNVYDYAKENFGLGMTTTKNLINIYKRFAEPISMSDVSEATYKLYYVKIKDDYVDYSMTQLVELLTVPEDEIISYSPTLSVREIRALKKVSQLTDYEKSFIDHVKDKFIYIYNEVKAMIDNYDIFAEFKFNLNTEKIIFKENKFTFNFNFKKHKTSFSVFISAYYDKYWFDLQSEPVNYNFETLRTASLNSLSTIDEVSKVILEIRDFIIDDLKEFYDKSDNSTNQVDELQEIINDFKEKYLTIKLERLLMPDIDNTLLKHGTWDLRGDIEFVRETYNKYSNHSIFQQEFTFGLDRYDFEVFYKISDNLYFYIKDRGFYFRFEVDNDDYVEDLDFGDLIKYPGVFKSYDIKCAATSSSFFSLFYDFAVNYWQQEQYKKYLEEKESNESNYDPDNDDFEPEDDINYDNE